MWFILRFGIAHAFEIGQNRPEQKGRRTMTSSTRDDRWKELCEAIVEESDSKRLIDLVDKLNRVLEEREIEFRRRSEIRNREF